MMHAPLLHRLKLTAAAALAAVALPSCINEDLSECGKDYQASYTVQLHTNITTELETELTTQLEKAFGIELRSALSNVFTDRAQDLDLSFYTDDERLAQHDVHQMDASQAAYTIYLPIRNYQNLALANTAAEPLVQLDGLNMQRTLHLQQNEQADTVPSQSVGLFSARMPMEVEERDQEFHANLYMQNCTACLVLDPRTAPVADITGCVTGLASAFAVNDSTYSFDHSVPVRATLQRSSTNRLLALHATGFASRDSLESPNSLDSRAPSATSKGAHSSATDKPAHFSATDKAATGKPALWQMKVYVRLRTGSVTESILSMHEPLRAGQLRILKATIRDDGGIVSTTPDVGIAIRLDWKPGGSHEVEI